MNDMQTMVRTQVAINGSSFFLAQDQDLVDLRQRIEAAMHTPGTFVDFVVVGNRWTSVLISPGTQVVLSIETVQYDSRDTGDDETPFGGLFDI